MLPLDYVAAADVDLLIKGLLSPAGKSFVSQSDPANHRKTREVVVVEDLPAYLQRVAQTVGQLDRPPRQVLIEAHVLEVELKDEYRHGVNLAYLDGDPKITLETKGGQKIVLAETGLVQIDNGQGATIEFIGNMVSINKGALEVT